MRNLLMLSLFMSTVVVACSSTGPRSSSGSRYAITAEEIAAARGVTAWDVVSELRPEFLRPHRSGSTANMPLVYMDGSRLGDIDRLRSVVISSIDRIEFVSAADATTRWGTGHVGGVILLHSRR